MIEELAENTEIPACTAFGVHDTVLKCISADKGVILDAAAGHGALSCKLQKMGFQVYPLDIKPSQFQCRIITCQAADLNIQIPFADAFFDGVISVETIEHLENPWHFIREIKRVLKPQGFVIITTPNITSIFSRIYFLFSKNFILFTKKDLLNKHHITPMTRWMLEGILESEGFEIQKICCSPGYVPYFDFYFKTNSLLFGHILVVVAKKP